MKQTASAAPLVVLPLLAACMVDVLTDVGMAGGVLYAVAATASFFFPSRRHTYAVAVAGSLLAGLGPLVLALSGSEIDVWQISVNRVLAIVAIWAIVILGARFERFRRSLAEAKQELARTEDELASTKGSLASAEAQLQKYSEKATTKLGEAAETLHTEQAQRRRMERALRDAKAQYVSLIESLSLHVLRKDRKGRFTYASPSFCQLIGKSLDEILGKTDLDLFPKHMADKYRQDDQKVLASKETFEGIEVHPKPGGGKMYVQVIKSAIFDTQGNAIGIQGLFWDVTKSKRAEVELRESEARKRAVFEAAMDCIMFLDQDGRIVEFNHASEETFGHNRGDVIGKDMTEVFVPEESRQRHRQNLLRYAGAGEMGSMLGRRLEIPMVKKSGETFLAEMTMQPIPLGGEAGFAAFIRDITLQKEAEEALHEEKEAAEASSRSKGAFVANMSHEIRTPMNAIIGMTEYVLNTGVTDEQREYLEMVLESGNSLLGLLNDVLDFSKIEAGKLGLDHVPFRLRGWLKESVKSLVFRAKEEHLDLECHVSADAPDCLIGDPYRVRQVLVNLVGNAIKFTDRGTITINVHRESQAEGAVAIRFEVKDTGMGIPEEMLKEIFREFEQADTSTRRHHGGTGLGLSICSRLVEMMKGRIGVESEVGKGSTFHFTIRFGLGSEEAEPDGAETSAIPGKPIQEIRDAIQLEPRAPLHVLVAEDSPVNQKLAIGLLRKKGHQVVVANNGHEAVEQFRTHRFDLVLMDVQMPDMDGFQATEAIREAEEDGTHTPIIAITAHAMKGDRERCLDAGMDGYLSKPIRANDLYSAIEQFTGQVPQDTAPGS
ncbi:MAG: PAS domain S-box protein [Planctomycetes bacterium]|nr:PAS domain S-box protein [Planctomycetota bacterium]MBL7041857.1 PAS domain S-box protein [Pirellulaceae bacterium]